MVGFRMKTDSGDGGFLTRQTGSLGDGGFLTRQTGSLGSRQSGRLVMDGRLQY